MFCPKCGCENKNNARFCVQCGAELVRETATQETTVLDASVKESAALKNASGNGSIAAPESVPKQKKPTLAICLTIIVVALIVVAGCVTVILVLNKGNDGEGSGETAEVTESAETDEVQDEDNVIAEDAEEENDETTADSVSTELSDEEQIQAVIESVLDYAYFAEFDLEEIFNSLPEEYYDHCETATGWDAATEAERQEAQKEYEEYIVDWRNKLFEEYGTDAIISIENVSEMDIEDVFGLDETDDVEDVEVVIEARAEELFGNMGYTPEFRFVTYTVTISGSKGTDTKDAFAEVWKLDNYGWFWPGGIENLLSL